MKYEKLATLQTNVVTAPDLGTFAVTFAGQSQPWLDTLSSVMASGNSKKPVSYTHLTLPTTPYV